MGNEESTLRESEAYGEFRLLEEGGSKVALIEKVI